jgi:hypothetical protein
MKKTLAITALAVITATVSYAQGLVSISLTGGNLVTTNSALGVSGKTTGVNAFYYELLDSTAILGSTANQIYGSASNFALWTDSTVSGVNGTGISAGKVTSGSSVAALNWAVGQASYALSTPDSYIIVGWSANYGTTWSAVANQIEQGTLAAGGYFGVTAVGVSAAGGGTSSLPAANLWNNSTGVAGQGLSAGLILTQVVPEPCTMALLGLGGLSLLVIRRRK